MDKIKPDHLVVFSKNKKMMGEKSLKGKYMMRKCIFSKALKWKHIKDNPMTSVDSPQFEKRDREIKL